MIKPNELRPGVYVSHTGKVLQVESYCNGKVNVYAGYYGGVPHIKGIDCGDIEPIPLTPEWLERCGFKKGSSYIGIGYHWDGPNDISIVEQNIDKDDTYRLYGSEWTIGKDFKFLHQLQNLYHALTGEELTIKETV